LHKQIKQCQYHIDSSVFLDMKDRGRMPHARDECCVRCSDVN